MKALSSTGDFIYVGDTALVVKDLHGLVRGSKVVVMLIYKDDHCQVFDYQSSKMFVTTGDTLAKIS